MYGYIKGFIKDIESNYIILENNNIGYLIYTPNPYAFILDNEETIYLYQNVKEDELSLYGFKTKEEKKLFIKLISVKGLGCKMALPIIATGSINGIVDAIERENILYLKKFPKIGEKLAKQIILDLKGKMASNENIYEADKTDELVSVLENLGYKNAEIKQIISNINRNNTLEVQVKEALKLLLK
ncbi:MAG: Holliday junction branch migration protein RuvA [Bacilli bacterium]